MLRRLVTLLFTLAFVPVMFAAQQNAQHSRPAAPSHQPSHQPSRQPAPSHQPRHSAPRAPERPRGHQPQGRVRDGRHFDRNTHHRIDRDRECRYRNGRREVFFEGFWFGYAFWPEWVFVEDVYIEQVGPSEYIIYCYYNPARQIQVYVVE